MKYFIIIGVFFLANCTSEKRAGSYYDPELYYQIQENYVHNTTNAIIKNGKPTRQFHSALGELCHYYQNGDITNDQLICSNGETQKQVRILQ